MRVDCDQVKADATGKWSGLMEALGISVGNGEHRSCPVCKTEKDHFRFDDRDGSGSWICTCGAGDGWKLVQEVLNIDFLEAVKTVAPLLGSIEPGAYQKEKVVSPDLLREMFTGSSPATNENGVGIYLRSRGLSLIPPKLRFHPGIREPETCQIYPAMLAVVTMPDDKAATIHRTFLDPGTFGKAKINKPKKLMPGLRKITGGAIRLFEAGDVLGVAEGLETAIACTQVFQIPTWSTVSAVMMAGFEPPINVKNVQVYCDNDANYTGQKAAYDLANRMVVKNKLRADVVEPVAVGDWLDEMLKG